jgi:hypothetical protein
MFCSAPTSQRCSVQANFRPLFANVQAIKFTDVQKNSVRRNGPAKMPESGHRSVMSTTRLDGNAEKEE